MIRVAVSSDVDGIARVHVSAWQSAYRGYMPDAHLDTLEPSKCAVMWAKTIVQPAAIVLVATAGEMLVRPALQPQPARGLAVDSQQGWPTPGRSQMTNEFARVGGEHASESALPPCPQMRSGQWRRRRVPQSDLNGGAAPPVKLNR